MLSQKEQQESGGQPSRTPPRDMMLVNDCCLAQLLDPAMAVDAVKVCWGGCWTRLWRWMRSRWCWVRGRESGVLLPG
jgi:hypothetical protein